MNDLLPPGVLPPGVIPPDGFQPNPQKPDGPLVLFARTAEQAPRYLFGFLLALIEAILGDSVTTALAIGSAALGFVLSSVFVGLAAFFLIYVLVRAINNLAGSIQVVAGSTAQHGIHVGAVAQAIRDTNQSPPRT